MGLKLIPMYSLQAVFNTWHLYVAGIEAVLRNSGDDTNIEKIYNEIMAGNLLLWVALLDGKYIGFLTTCFQDIPQAGRALWIVHTYKTPKTESAWLLEGLKVIEKFAKEKGCKAVKFYALKKPWQTKLEMIGYKQGYTEFIKEVQHEDLSQINTPDGGLQSP